MNLQKRNIFLFWIGKEYKLISILRNLIYLHSTNGIGYNVILITHENIKDYIHDIPEYFYNLCPAHQADFVRVNVICDYGGIWLDSDTLVLDSLDSLFDIVDRKDGFLIKENNQKLTNGIFGSKKETKFMKLWKNNVRTKLDTKNGNIGWLCIGGFMMDCIFSSNKSLFENYDIFQGLDNLYPVNWNNCVTEFINKPYDNYKNIIRNNQPLVVLVHSVYKKLENKTTEEILNGNMPINYFINKSFDNMGIKKNKLNNGYKIYNYGARIVVYADWLESYLTSEHFKFVKNLENNGWKIIKLSKINVEEIKKEKTIILCVTYDSFDISQLSCENVTLIYKIDDLYPYKDIRKKCIDSANFLISPYQYLFKDKAIIKMYPHIDLKESYHIPYSAVNIFYENIDFNNTPKNKIFVSGNVTNEYPLRQYILRFKQYIDILEHPGYNVNKHKVVRGQYYKTLSEYLCCFTDASRYNYILLKVFEICSVGALLLCDDSIKNQLCNLGFYDNINYIACNKENMESKIKWILDDKNRKTIDEIRLKGMSLVRNNHSTSNRSHAFNTIINNKYF